MGQPQEVDKADQSVFFKLAPVVLSAEAPWSWPKERLRGCEPDRVRAAFTTKDVNDEHGGAFHVREGVSIEYKH